MKICAIIPTYNNARTIADVAHRTAKYLKDIIIVIDGATDDTREVISGLRENDHATFDASVSMTVVDYEKNHGKGYALVQGFKKAKEMGFSHALTIDSDGQHYPEDIPALLNVSRQQPECYVVGNRNIEADNMPGKNTFANKFSNFWFAVQTGKYLPDTQTGLRIYPLDRLHGLRLITSRYEAELELLVFATWACEKVVSVPVRVYYPPKEERVSHFRPAYDFARISLLNTILCFFALIYGLPRRWWRVVVYFPIFATSWLLFLVFTLFCFIFRVNKHFYRRVFHYGAFVLMHTMPAIPFKVQGLRLKAQGSEVKEQGSKSKAKRAESPAVVIANHTSLFDILSAVAIYKDLTIVAQDWVFRNPFFALTAHCAGFLSVKNGIENILPTLQTEVEHGASVLVFPEGGRSKDGTIRRFHRGAFYLAEKLALPLQPLFIRGTFRLMSKGEVYLGKTRINITILEPITQSDTSFGDDYKTRATKVQHYYEELSIL